MTLDDANSLPPEAFVETFGSIYEHSPWVAEAAIEQRPFSGPSSLADRMRASVDGAPYDEKLALLRAHPELAFV